VKGAVHVVFKDTVSAAGICVYAICSSRKAAVMARSRVAKAKKRNHPGPAGTIIYYDRPLSDPYAAEIRIVKIQVDVLYREGLDEAKLDEFAGNLNEQGIIR
jgi:hypothetical protein